MASALSGMVNQSSAAVAGGVVPFRMGNSHPSLFPYEPMECADGELIITAGNNGQFRKLVEVLGVPELADDPRFARNEDRTANRDELRPLLVERLRTRGKQEWFELIFAAACRAGRSTPSTAVCLAEQVGLDPVVQVGGIPSIRNPITFSATPPSYRLPPPGLDEHRRRDPGVADPAMTEPPHLRDGAGRLLPRDHHPAGHRPGRDVMGTVGFGELAFWLATQRRPTPGQVRVFEAVLAALADHGFTPTAIVTRLTYLSAPDSVQGRAGRRAARRRLTVPGRHRGLRPFLDDVLQAQDELPTDDAAGTPSR